MYAQIVNCVVDLIGGVNEGLPLPDQYLAENPYILNVDIGENTSNIEVGWKYIDGVFIEPIIELPDPTTVTVTNEEIKELTLLAIGISLEVADMIAGG